MTVWSDRILAQLVEAGCSTHLAVLEYIGRRQTRTNTDTEQLPAFVRVQLKTHARMISHKCVIIRDSIAGARPLYTSPKLHGPET